MNTCKNPLKLTYEENLLAGYKVNKPFNQNGEYVDKKVADDMLEVLKTTNKYFTDLQNRCKLKRSEERLWKKIAGVIEQAIKTS